MASVNVPTNTKIKEQDINTKLQLYGIFTAFSNGKVPSNKQIDVALNSTLAHRSLSSPSKKLSSEGQKLIGDLREVISEAKVLLLSKNDGNLLQDFIWQTQQLSGGNASKPNAPIGKETAKQHGNEALDGLRTLGTLLITNGQFRKLLSDASVLLRDIAGDAAQKAATKVNPSDQQLKNIDEPAEDNTWHDAPDLSKDTLKSKLNEKKPFNRSDLKEAAGDATQAAHPSGSRDPADAADLAAQDQQKGTSSGVDAKQGLRQAKDTLQGKAQKNTPDEDQDQAQEAADKAAGTKDRTAGYLKNKFSDERREQTIYRLKKMIVEIQGHPDYQQAIESLLRLAEEYTGHGKNLAKQTHGTVKGAHDDDSLQRVETDLKTLLERFANSTSMDDLIDSINNIYSDADADPELKGWFRSMDKYVRKCLQRQGFVLEDKATEEWNELYDHGNYLLRDRYRNHTDRILDEFKFFGDQFDKDPQNKKFASSMQTLFNDLGNDENGQPTFKPHLIKDLTEVIIPSVFESIRYVPIPRIEYTDKMIDAVVENLVLEGDNLAPNVMEFGSDNYWRWGRKQIANKNKNKVMLSISGVQCDLRDVAYYVKKKEGFPGITDKGVMDIFLGGTGLSFKVAMETADKSDNLHFFKVNTVHVELKNLNIKLKQSNHKLLFGLFKPLLLKVMRPVIQKVIEKQIRDNIHQLDGIAYKIKKEADRAQAEAKRNPDPENLQNIYQTYFNAAQQQLSKAQQKKEEAKEAASDKQVNIALTQHDSLFKNIKLPGGISTKATEYKDLASKGDKWQSPVFSIGSAKESSNLPRVSKVERKSHGVTEGGVRGGKDLDDSERQTTSGGNTGGYTGGSSGGYDGGYEESAVSGQYEGQGTGIDTGAYTGTSSSNFTSEVDQAFTGTNGGAGQHTGTLLGKNNPVWSGQA